MTVQLILVSNGEPVGSLSADTDPDGRTRIVYEVDNNGRGARLAETLRLDAVCRCGGRSTARRSWAARCTRGSRSTPTGRARWSSQADEGTTTAEGFYLPADASPYGLVLLVERALATGRPVPLLPAGEGRGRLGAAR